MSDQNKSSETIGDTARANCENREKIKSQKCGMLSQKLADEIDKNLKNRGNLYSDIINSSKKGEKTFFSGTSIHGRSYPKGSYQDTMVELEKYECTDIRKLNRMLTDVSKKNNIGIEVTEITGYNFYMKFAW